MATHYQRYDFHALKSKVGVTDVASALGYVIDRRAGIGRYVEMVKTDGNTVTDRIIVKNPGDPASQMWFRRDGSRGDAITLIRDNLNSFNVDRSDNEWQRIGAALSRLANSPAVNQESRHTFRASQSGSFDTSRYRKESFSTSDKTPTLFTSRGFIRETFELFSPYINKVYDLKAENFKGYNIGFPYVIPGVTPNGECVGYEIRGQHGFKSKAAGTDSTHGLWLADFTGGVTQSARKVFFFESAFDAMAYCQHHRASLDLSTSVFASVGGQMSEEQVHETMKHYNNASFVDCFDNDISGRIYGLRSALIVADVQASVQRHPSGDIAVTLMDGQYTLPQTFTAESLTTYVDLKGRYTQSLPPNGFKDWNDVVMGNGANQLGSPNKHQRNTALAERRDGVKFK